jgi:hypothetical protein
MSTLAIPLPDDKHERLKALARANSISVNKLVDELATVALANYDARVRFETRAARGKPTRALTLLDKLGLGGLRLAVVSVTRRRQRLPAAAVPSGRFGSAHW